MIKFDKDKVLLLHQLITQETGGSAGVRDYGLLYAFNNKILSRCMRLFCCHFFVYRGKSNNIFPAILLT